MTRLDQVREEALRLTPRQRLRLAQDLHASVMTAEEHEVEEAWLDEVEQRLAEWQAGTAKTFSGEEVIARLREKYGRTRVGVGR